MGPQEEAIREALAAGPTAGPWQIRMGRDKWGLTGYQVFTHTHAAVCVAAEDYYALGKYPAADEDGYYQPDKRIDCLPHRVASARYIAAANPQAVMELLDDLDRAREEAAEWEERARALGWQDPPSGTHAVCGGAVA